MKMLNKYIMITATTILISHNSQATAMQHIEDMRLEDRTKQELYEKIKKEVIKDMQKDINTSTFLENEIKKERDINAELKKQIKKEREINTALKKEIKDLKKKKRLGLKRKMKKLILNRELSS